MKVRRPTAVGRRASQAERVIHWLSLFMAIYTPLCLCLEQLSRKFSRQDTQCVRSCDPLNSLRA